MTKYITIGLFLLFFTTVNAQYKVIYNSSSKTLKPVSQKDDGAEFTFGLSDVSLNSFIEDGTHFIDLNSLGLNNSMEEGMPALPQYTKLLYFPKDYHVELQNVKINYDTLNLTEKSIQGVVSPATGSVSKGEEKPKVSQVKLSSAYNSNSFINDNSIELKRIGVMRDEVVYELLINAVAYNGVTNELKIVKDLSFSLKNNEGSTIESNSILEKTVRKSASLSKEETFLIVSPSKYKSSLQQYILWKKQLGFNVIEAYLDDDIVNTTNEAIKDYIESYYTSPIEGDEILSYLLLVGDVSELPTWNGTVDYHVTDLYYAEFTDDYLPDIYYGRMSVTDTSQLNNIINKVIHTEKALFENDYQNNHLLVSGVDSYYAPEYGNGAINYFVDYYSNIENGITPKYYLYGSGSEITSNSSLAKQSIINDFNEGVGVAYYTAHCSSNGWTDPAFQTSDISSLSNEGMYPLMIGNCCESAKFNLASFSEDITRAKNKGAATYIGASDFSYWDEDYYWGIGLSETIDANPTYEATDLGAWDAWFHTHGENTDQVAYTASQIVTIGNLAVQSSNSTLKKYYWEVYHVIGDPTFISPINKQNTIEATYSKVLVAGQSNYSVTAPYGSYVSLAVNKTFVVGEFADEDGNVSLEFDGLQDVGTKLVELVVSHPNNAPLIDSLDVIPPDGPYVLFQDFVIDDVEGNNDAAFDYNEIVYLDLSFGNVGVGEANNVIVNVESQSEFVEQISLNNDLSLGVIKVDSAVSTTNKVRIELNSGVANNSKVFFNGTIQYNDTIYRDFSFAVNIKSPSIVMYDVVIDENGLGNLDGVLLENEVATLNLSFINESLSQVSNTLLTISSINKEFISFSDSVFALGGFNEGSIVSNDFNILVSDQIIHGAQATINFEIVAGENNEYNTTGSFDVLVGIEPEFNLEIDTTVYVVNAKFYDSGGPDSNYGSSENNTITFLPYKSNQGLIVDFSYLEIESGSSGKCWDNLNVYDGISTDSNLIGELCSDIFELNIVSQNNNGALTFNFISDSDIVEKGWEGMIKSSDKYNVNVVVTNGISLLDSATVTLGRKVQVTNGGGVGFDNILEKGTYILQVDYEGYYGFTQDIHSINSDTTIQVFLTKLPEVCFSISTGTSFVSGARVLFNNLEQLSDVNGQVSFPKQTEGTYNYYVEAEGYNDESGSLTVPNYDICHYVSLKKPESYQYRLKVYEDTGIVVGAKVELNDVIKITDEYGMVQFDSIYPGSYSLSIDQSTYKPYGSMVNIQDSNVYQEIEITPLTYSAIFNVKHHETIVADADIIIDDTVIYTSAGGQAFINGLRGNSNYEYSVKHSYYNEVNGVLKIMDKSAEVDINLFLVGLNEASKNLKIYPNPLGNDKILNIRSDELISSIELFSLTGMSIYKAENNTSYLSMDLSSYLSGVYLLKVLVGNKPEFLRIVVP